MRERECDAEIEPVGHAEVREERKGVGRRLELQGRLDEIPLDSAAALILAARRLRGRTELVDAAFPVLLRHAGHSENLLMGYQVVFTQTTALVAVLLAVIARSREADPARSATWAGVLRAGRPSVCPRRIFCGFFHLPVQRPATSAG